MIRALALVLVLGTATLASAQDAPTLSGPIEFEIDSAVIQRRSFAVIDELAQWLREHPEARVEIQAHTDPEWVCEHCGRRLTRDRAYSVRAALIERGIDSSRLEAHGHRGEQPLATCDQRRRRVRRACQIRNRRIEVHALSQSD